MVRKRKNLWEDPEECSPSNGDEVLVEFEDGTRAIAWQEYGEWPDEFDKMSSLKRWRQLTEEDWKLIYKFYETLP